VPSDVKFIKCAFCKEMVKEVVARAAEVRQKTKPLRADEDDYGAALEDICELGSTCICPLFSLLTGLCFRAVIGKASWLRKLDIVDEEDGTLGLKRYDVEGTCRNNCHTCALTCKRHFNEYDIELASLLYEGASAAKIEKALCHRLTGGTYIFFFSFFIKRQPPPKKLLQPARNRSQSHHHRAPRMKPSSLWRSTKSRWSRYVFFFFWAIAITYFIFFPKQHMKYLDFAGKNERQRTVPPTTNTGPTEKKGPQMTPQTENPLVNALIQDKVERF